MVSPVPKHLRTEEEVQSIPEDFREHVTDLSPDISRKVTIPNSGSHRAKYAPGLSSTLVSLAKSESIGDPMAGTGMISWETGIPMALNDIDLNMRQFLDPLRERGCEVSYGPADRVPWKRDVCIFSPPYYPRTDRRRPNAHDDEKRGPVVGFRDSYLGDHPRFIGNPGGVNAIMTYRLQMADVYRHMTSVCKTMIVVTKNWTRLGVELRLDLDTILIAQDAGWTLTSRHGWVPPASLWARYNQKRGGGVQIEDVLIFKLAEQASSLDDLKQAS